MKTVQAARAPVARVVVRAYRVPTETPESDGTIAWDATGVVVVELSGGGETGLGYAYADVAAAEVVRRDLASVIQGRDALDVPAAYEAMVRCVRNIGQPGLVASAIAAVDVALWDLKAKLLGVPLAKLLGLCREAIPVYGSGGFTDYSLSQLESQLGGWAASGIGMVKMKVGTHPEADLSRVKAAKAAIGDARLFVDANGAYSRKQALAFAERYAELGVVWFEEPVSSDDLEGLRLLRDRAPGGLDIAAGEYGYGGTYFRRMLEHGAVDVLQADATRCKGITGFLQAGALAQAFLLPLSAHTSPSLHVHPCVSLPSAVHVEYFFDHVRIEHLLFDGAVTAEGGVIRPDLSRAGLGLALKAKAASRYEV